jgi:hypothetical protein
MELNFRLGGQWESKGGSKHQGTDVTGNSGRAAEVWLDAANLC